MKNKLRLQRALKSVLDQKEDTTNSIPGLLGTLKNGKQRVKVNGRKGFVYVRLHGNMSETVQAYNDQVLQLYGMPVLVKRVQGKGYHYYVTGKDTGRYQNWGGNNAQAQYAQHGNQHSFGIGAGGSDVVWVFKKQFMPLLLYPYSGTSVRIADDWYQWGDIYKHFTGSVVDIGAAKPAIIGDARFVTLYVEGSSNTIKGVTGSLFTSTPFPSDVTPYINVPTPSQGIPLSAVLLTADTVNIAWNNIYDDIRPIYGVGGDTAYSTGTISTIGQTLYFTPDSVSPTPTITGSSNYNLSYERSDNEGTAGTSTSESNFIIATFVNINYDVRYIGAGSWSVELELTGNSTDDIYISAELYKKDASGTETLLSTTSSSTPTSTFYHCILPGTLLAAAIIPSTSRIFVRIRGIKAGWSAAVVNPGILVGGIHNSNLSFAASSVFGGGHVFEWNGVPVTQRGYANFVGGGVSVTDDPVNAVTTIAIPGTVSYDNGVFKVSGSSIDFGAGLHVDVTGSVAYVQSIDTTLDDLNTHEPFIVIAHRGDINNTDGYPEDTVAAILSAYWKGAHRSEVDVNQSADGTWYVIHDATVDRTTNGTGNVVDKTDAQMDALWIDGGYGYNITRHSGTYHPPTLQAVLTALDPLDTTIQIENKTVSNSRSIAELIVTNNWQHRATIQVQSQAEAQDVNAVSPAIKVVSHSSTIWTETDTISAQTGTYTEAQIAAYAPKQVIIYDSINNYTGSNQTTLIRDAWDIGARGFNTWDLNVAFYEYQKFRYLDDHIADPNAHPGLGGGGGSALTVYGQGIQKTTGTTGIDFEDGFGVIASGSVAYISCFGVTVSGSAAAPYDARFVMGEADAGVPNGVVKNYLLDNYDIDAYPTSPTSWDDDFNSASINAKWTQINNPAGANAFSTSLYPGYLYVGLLENVAGQDIFQAQPRICQVAPTGVDATGTFSFIAKVSLAAEGMAAEAAEYCAIHLYLGTSGTFEFISADIEFNDSLSVNESSRCLGGVNGTTGSMAGMTTTQFQAIDPTDFVYLKLSKLTSGAYTAANTYEAYYSRNGIIWQDVGTHSKTFTGMPNEIGLVFRRPKFQTGTPKGHALVDLFRKV